MANYYVAIDIRFFSFVFKLFTLKYSFLFT
jgi:hypothetical protein